jgi:hypothetical protein
MVRGRSIHRVGREPKSRKLGRQSSKDVGRPGEQRRRSRDVIEGLRRELGVDKASSESRESSKWTSGGQGRRGRSSGGLSSRKFSAFTDGYVSRSQVYTPEPEYVSHK